MTQDDYDDAVEVGFFLGVRLMEALHELDQTPHSFERTQAFLRQVAAGSVTLGRTPAELRLQMPDLDAHELEQHHRRSIQQNQKQAESVLRAQAKRTKR